MNLEINAMERFKKYAQFKNCVAIGANVFVKSNNQVVIGNFTEDEARCERYDDCYAFEDGRVIIKNDVLDFILRQQTQ